ncbi:hypothetical protein JMJ35_008447 [Cladonia borealis]|uniref:Structure-specific endonuclease subunit SLX4 n=1 Tax=Cladonia borealis TaxID=184061 RepID=A0AA39QWD7_9LECA|nr:hypothetical protein JMJ35_008447 [Cladonia borealis]
MAATPTFVPSSTPTRALAGNLPAHTKPTAMSSSPSLPSPSQLFSSMPLRPQSGSSANPIPADAVVGFTSASSLLPQEHSKSEYASMVGLERLESGGLSGLRQENDLHSKSKTTKLRPEKEPTSKKRRVSREEQADPLQRNADIAQLKVFEDCKRDDEALAPKKRHKKKSTEGDQAQTKIKKSKITKPGAPKGVLKPKKTSTLTRKPSEARSATAELLMGTQAEDAQAREEFRDLCLEKAIPRRKDWTPVKDTVQPKIHIDALEGHSVSAPPSNTPEANASSDICFGKLMGDYSFAQKIECAATSFEGLRKGDGESIVKRRKIELVNGTSGTLPAEKAQRTKSPKKKAQTVTAKATAPFVPVEQSITSSLMQYFGPPVVAAGIETNGQDEPVATPVTAARKSSVTKAAKSKRTTTKANKTNKQAQRILLSPESAMKTASNQVLVFGTSSQLAREESPSLIEQVQQAISQSIDDECKFLDVSSARYKPYNSLAVTRSKDLWSVASRSLEGELLKAEVVDLSITPKPCKDLPQPTPILEGLELLQTEQEMVVDSGHDVAVAGTSTAPVPGIDASPTPQLQVQGPDLTLPRSVAEKALKKRPKTRSPVKQVKSLPDQMPNYKGYTDVQLSKEVASYGFKSIKKREAMIMLLERCWESKVSMALQEVPMNANICQPATCNVDATNEKSEKKSPVKKKGRPPKVAAALLPTPGEGADPPLKKPRGRPRKDTSSTSTPTKRKRKVSSPNRSNVTATVAALDADEIYDSSPPTPSPPRRRPRSKPPSQLPLSQIIGTSADHTNMANSKVNEARLFAEVTKAITSFPPSYDPENLTFHQKMLLYEPVVLEDLTAWLNAEGLNRIGEDNEVLPEQVKAWCEARSVCCLWKENLRGGARARW